MSSKLSPKKDDKVTAASPTKKDTKAAPTIMTRHQSVVMNTRQLRNQDVSRKKISAITQLLLSPNKDKTKYTTFNKRRSPKDKKPKTKESPKKQQTVKVTQLVLEAKKEAKAAGKKRKIEAEPKEVRPGKSRKETLSIQELIDICEEQSLDDEDFLEILTCESPVWWEQPDNQYYCEDAIATTTEQKKYFKQFFKSQAKTEETITQNNVNANETNKNLPATNLNIPEVKKSDDRFMKKRSKLENLLGNIKNKLTDTPKEENKVAVNVIDQRLDIPEKMPAKEKSNDTNITKKVDENTIEDKIEIIKPRNVKTPSESTSSSDDMFFGFQNEDILKDLENMEIPIKEDELCKENTESMDTSPEKCKEIEENNPRNNKKIEEINSEEEAKTVSVNSSDLIIEETPISNFSLEASKQGTDMLKEDQSITETKKPEITTSFDINTNTSGNAVTSDTQSILEKRLSANVEKPKSLKSDEAKTPETKPSLDSVTNKSNTSVNLGTHSDIEKTSCSNIETTQTHKPFGSVKIYYIDVSTPKNDKVSNTNDTKVTIKDLLTNTKSDESTLCKESKNNEKSSTGTTIGKQKVESGDNDAATTLSKGNEGVPSSTMTVKDLPTNKKIDESTMLNKESENNEKLSTSIIIANQNNETENNIQSVNTDESKEDFVNVDKTKDKNDTNKEDRNAKILMEKDSAKTEKDVKPVKAKQVNKEQLMAVYKIITDKQYRQNYMKTVQDEVQKEPKIINNYLASADGLKTFFNKCADSSRPQTQTLDALLTKDKDSSADKAKSNVIDAGKKISDDVKQNLDIANDKANEINEDYKITNEVSQSLNKDKANDGKIVNSDLEESSKPINTLEINKICENKKNDQAKDEKIAIVTKTDVKDNNDKLCGKCDETNAETSFNITSKVKSAKYCLKCSSIFESETCSYCAKKSKLNVENPQQSRKGNS